jgi:hypothetical protein
MIVTGENQRTQRKTYPSATLSTTNPTWTDPGANPGVCSDRLVTNSLSHGTALKYLSKKNEVWYFIKVITKF